MKQTEKLKKAKPPKEKVEPKKLVEKKVEPKPEEKVDAVFLKDAPGFGKKGEIRKMTKTAMAYINSEIKGVVKKL